MSAFFGNHLFYFFGHGGPWCFGAYEGSTFGPLALSALKNFPGSRVPANSNPYKLVFIDGCQAGKCSLCECFGIPSQIVDTNFFIAAGVRSRAFIGFTEDGGFNTYQYLQRAGMLANFWNGWLNHHSLHYCLTNAQNSTNAQAMPTSAIIRGATNMSIDAP
jgi:hypothetical protein